LLSIRFYLTYVLIFVVYPTIGVNGAELLQAGVKFNPISFIWELAPIGLAFTIFIGLATRASSVGVMVAVAIGLVQSKFGSEIAALEMPLVWFLLSGSLLLDGAGRLSSDGKIWKVVTRITWEKSIQRRMNDNPGERIQVHHLDGNPTNNDPENLVCLSDLESPPDIYKTDKPKYNPNQLDYRE
jgi:hypothetical protein